MLGKIYGGAMVLCLISGSAFFDASVLIGSTLILAAICFFFLAKAEGAFYEEHDNSDIDRLLADYNAKMHGKGKRTDSAKGSGNDLL